MSPCDGVGTSLRSDLWQWFKAIIRHWIEIAGGAAFAVISLIFSIWFGDWLRLLSLVILATALAWATFLAWRDEHRKTIGKALRSILNRIVETADESPDLLRPLVEASEEFNSEEGVEWVCQQLDQHGHADPLTVLSEVSTFEFDGKRLRFLRDARVARIFRLEEAIDYVLFTWGPKNGLTQKTTGPS